MASVSICQAICLVFEPGVMNQLLSVDRELTRDLAPLRRGWPCGECRGWRTAGAPRSRGWPGGVPLAHSQLMMRLLVMEIVLTTILVSVILEHGDGRRWQQTPGCVIAQDEHAGEISEGSSFLSVGDSSFWRRS